VVGQTFKSLNKIYLLMLVRQLKELIKDKVTLNSPAKITFL